MGTVVLELEYSLKKNRVKWHSSRLVGDMSEQALCNGVVIDVLVKKMAYRFAKIKVHV